MFSRRPVFTVAKFTEDLIAQPFVENLSAVIGGIQPGAVAAVIAAEGFGCIHELSTKSLDAIGM